MRDLPYELCYDEPEWYKTKQGIVKKGRFCTTCQKMIPPGFPFYEEISRDEGKTTRSLTCTYEFPCVVDFKPCPDCDCYGLAEGFDAQGYPIICQTCQGKGYLPNLSTREG